jgi:hypothetical protein
LLRPCGQLIADIINLSNNVDLDNNCGDTGVIPITGGAVARLVE